MPREGGASSTPRPFRIQQTSLEYWIIRLRGWWPSGLARRPLNAGSVGLISRRPQSRLHPWI